GTSDGTKGGWFHKSRRYAFHQRMHTLIGASLSSGLFRDPNRVLGCSPSSGASPDHPRDPSSDSSRTLNDALIHARVIRAKSPGLQKKNVRGAASLKRTMGENLHDSFLGIYYKLHVYLSGPQAPVEALVGWWEQVPEFQKAGGRGGLRSTRRPRTGQAGSSL